MFYNNMSSGNDTGYNLVALPYQVAIKDRLVNPDQLLDEMREDGIDPILWAIEMLTIFYGESDNAYYKYDKLNNCRTLYHPFLPRYLQEQIDIKEFKTPLKKAGEIRIVSGDIALMSGAKNDNTILSVISAYPNKTNQHYIREVKYMEKISGGTQLGYHGLRVRQLFDEFDCDYIVLDTNGIGMQVYSDLVRDMNDPDDPNKIYYGLGCMNDASMQQLVQNPDADKLIFSVKADANFNKQCNSALQADINRRHIKFLIDEQQADELLVTHKDYPKWRSTVDGINVYNKVISSYKESTSLVNEMVNLELVDIEKVKLKEKSGKRKDRFSSVVYGNYFITTLESKLFKGSMFNWESMCGISNVSRGYSRDIGY